MYAGNLEGNNPLGRPGRRWEHNITKSSGENKSPTLAYTDRIEKRRVRQFFYYSV
jgi:hypothetical protein